MKRRGAKRWRLTIVRNNCRNTQNAEALEAIFRRNERGEEGEESTNEGEKRACVQTPPYARARAHAMPARGSVQEEKRMVVTPWKNCDNALALNPPRRKGRIRAEDR